MCFVAQVYFLPMCEVKCFHLNPISVNPGLLCGLLSSDLHSLLWTGGEQSICIHQVCDKVQLTRF